MIKDKTGIKRETVFIIISVVLSLGIISATLLSLGFTASEITGALNPDLSGEARAINFNLQGYKDLGIGQ